MNKIAALLVVCLLAMPAMAAPFYVTGTFNGWVNPGYLMTEVTPGVLFQTTITGPTGDQSFKVNDGTWTNAWPVNDLQADFGGGVPLTINYMPGPFTDGWVPNINRVGYNDPGTNGWEIMGSFNGWGSPVVACTGMGSGLYSATYAVPDPGTYEFKFRKVNDWGVSIGNLAFGGNIQVTTTSPGEVLTMQLDLPNGRTLVTPEPASLALLLIGGLAILRRR